MDSLHEFSARVAARLAATPRPNASAGESARYMAQFEPKYRQFEQLASRLLTEIVQPRLEVVAHFFPGARVRPAVQENRCAAWFGFCERFPATAKVELTIDADQALDNVVLRCEVTIVPSFVKYDAHDKLVLPLDQVDEPRTAAWVEERLLAFLDTYLQLDRGDEDSSEVTATDPVCGMQVNAPDALQADHRGHAYYFCSADCRQRFMAAPARYIHLDVE